MLEGGQNTSFDKIDLSTLCRIDMNLSYQPLGGNDSKASTRAQCAIYTLSSRHHFGCITRMW